MKYTIILVCGFGGTPICPTLDSANIDRPMRMGMILSGSRSDKSGSHRNGTPRNAMVFANTKNSASSTGIGSSMGKQPPNGLTPCSL